MQTKRMAIGNQNCMVTNRDEREKNGKVISEIKAFEFMKIARIAIDGQKINCVSLFQLKCDVARVFRNFFFLSHFN